MKKAKIKKATKKPKLSYQPYEYFVDEWPADSVTADMQARANEVGAEGWQLLFVGSYGGAPNNIRVWYMRSKKGSKS